MRVGLWLRLLVSYLGVAVVAGATLFAAINLAAPATFEQAMGHGGGMTGMGDMMSALVRQAFGQALQTGLALALAAATAVAVVASAALSLRISRPIGRLAEASQRIADGRYDERVAVTSNDEVGDLAVSFNSMAASLETTEKRRLDLVGDVAHELRTPLATIESYLEGLEDGLVRPSGETWQLLRGETERLSRLVNDLQELWRAEAGQLPLLITRLDVGPQLQAAADRFAASAHEQRVAVVIEPVAGLAASADTARLAQVIDNFLANALRYSPAGGRVTLRANRAGAEVAVHVTDEGPGLTEEQLGRVFERFYRVDPGRSRALGGSGIGLAIARALAVAMGGRVTAASPGLGRGATFSLLLPAA
ncbi:MAG: ATP-binding protein [Chloroflexota bacterium]|nr:ATP-binding protein [Chloroflexota bacterium]